MNHTINLRRNRSWIYVVIVMFIFLGLFTFMTSNIYMGKEEKVFQTQRHKRLPLTATSTIEIHKWSYNPDKHFAIAMLSIDGEDDVNLSFKAYEESNANTELPVKVLYHHNQNVVVSIGHLSNNWGAIALDVYDQNEENNLMDVEDIQTGNVDNTSENQTKTLVTTLYTDQRKTKPVSDLDVKDKDQYTVMFTKSAIRDSKNEIERYDAAIKQAYHEKQKIKGEIQKLKEEMRYQTKEEINNTKSAISAKESNIDEINRTIEGYKYAKDNEKEKIKNLNEKINSITG